VIDRAVIAALRLRVARLDWLWPLLARLAVGVVFVTTGWRAIHILDDVTAFFAELGIPWPRLNAVVVAYTELICGGLLLAGLATRLAALPLIAIMTVAIATAKLAAIHGVSDLFRQIEALYIVLLIALAIAGPGAVSIDGWLARRVRR
jgi:putative oxidoreductase